VIDNQETKNIVKKPVQFVGTGFFYELLAE